MLYAYRYLLPLRLGWLLVCCLYKEVYLQIFKCVSFWLHGCCGKWEGSARKPVNHTSWMAVNTPTERPKSICNRCVIELFCGVVCVVTLPFWHFCWCKGFCHRTESDLFLFKCAKPCDEFVSVKGTPWRQEEDASFAMILTKCDVYNHAKLYCSWEFGMDYLLSKCIHQSTERVKEWILNQIGIITTRVCSFCQFLLILLVLLETFLFLCLTCRSAREPFQCVKLAASLTPQDDVGRYTWHEDYGM